MIKVAVSLFILIFCLYLGVNQALATQYTIQVGGSPPASYSTCSNLSGCDIGICWNSWAPGQTDCGQACLDSNNRAFGSAWSKYSYSGVCYVSDVNPITGEQTCTSIYDRISDVCSTADKCDDGIGGPITPPSYLKAGFCNCTIGGIYKTCCTNTSPSFVSSDVCVQVTNDPYNPPFEGVCPAGSDWVMCGVSQATCNEVNAIYGPGKCTTAPCGQEACGPPVTCTLSSRTPNPFTQCGGTCNGITYPSNHTIEVTESTCTDNTTQYSCSDLGVVCNQCGNTCIERPSCSVSWTLSNTNPPTNTTVDVTVNGTATSWNGASYSLDGGGWINVSPGPPFNFNVNSDSPGTHSLRFAINNGSTVCGSQNSETFITQSPNDASTCTAISVNSGNCVNPNQSYSATVSFRNDGTSTWINSGSNPYRLGSQDPQDNTVWGLNRVDLPSTVSPGGSVTFNFNVATSATSGTQSFNWQMVHEGIQWFGSRCFYNVNVCTSNPPAPTVSTSLPCIDPGYSGSGFTVSWTNAGVSWVNISTDSAFGSYYHKSVTGFSTTAPDGFNLNPSNPSQPLTLNPTTTYYARTFNGTQNSLVSSFTTPPTCTAAFDYSLSNSGGITVNQGSSGSNTITRTFISGITAGVTLSVASGLPAGASPTFTNNPCSPTCSSTLTISTLSTTPTGSSTITVIGSPLGKTTAFTLTVNAASISICGNNICESGEPLSCPLDCPGVPPGPGGPVCPNQRCEVGETPLSCPLDCPPAGPICGNLTCESGEPLSCPLDCPGDCPWIQTSGGDVHSNTGINTSCGP